MTCTSCSNELDVNDAFCGSCGSKVMSPAASSAIPVVPGEMRQDVIQQTADQRIPPVAQIPPAPTVPPVQQPPVSPGT